MCSVRLSICLPRSLDKAAISGAATHARLAQLTLLEPFMDDPRSAADPGIDLNGTGRTVSGAGSALHTCVPVDDKHLLFI